MHMWKCIILCMYNHYMIYTYVITLLHNCQYYIDWTGICVFFYIHTTKDIWQHRKAIHINTPFLGYFRLESPQPCHHHALLGDELPLPTSGVEVLWRGASPDSFESGNRAPEPVAAAVVVVIVEYLKCTSRRSAMNLQCRLFGSWFGFMMFNVYLWYCASKAERAVVLTGIPIVAILLVRRAELSWIVSGRGQYIYIYTYRLVFLWLGVFWIGTGCHLLVLHCIFVYLFCLRVIIFMQSSANMWSLPDTFQCAAGLPQDQGLLFVPLKWNIRSI